MNIPRRGVFQIFRNEIWGCKNYKSNSIDNFTLRHGAIQKEITRDIFLAVRRKSASVSDERLNNFIVGLTNNPPAMTFPNAMATTYTSYTLCGQWPGVTPPGQILPVRCAAGLEPFRYIVVLNHQSYLTICELQAFVTGLVSQCMQLVVFQVL